MRNIWEKISLKEDKNQKNYDIFNERIFEEYNNYKNEFRVINDLLERMPNYYSGDLKFIFGQIITSAPLNPEMIPLINVYNKKLILDINPLSVFLKLEKR